MQNVPWGSTDDLLAWLPDLVTDEDAPGSSGDDLAWLADLPSDDPRDVGGLLQLLSSTPSEGGPSSGVEAAPVHTAESTATAQQQTAPQMPSAVPDPLQQPAPPQALAHSMPGLQPAAGPGVLSRWSSGGSLRSSGMLLPPLTDSVASSSCNAGASLLGLGQPQLSAAAATQYNAQPGVRSAATPAWDPAPACASSLPAPAMHSAAGPGLYSDNSTAVLAAAAAAAAAVMQLPLDASHEQQPHAPRAASLQLPASTGSHSWAAGHHTTGLGSAGGSAVTSGLDLPAFRTHASEAAAATPWAAADVDVIQTTGTPPAQYAATAAPGGSSLPASERSAPSAAPPAPTGATATGTSGGQASGGSSSRQSVKSAGQAKQRQAGTARLRRAGAGVAKPAVEEPTLKLTPDQERRLLALATMPPAPTAAERSRVSSQNRSESTAALQSKLQELQSSRAQLSAQLVWLRSQLTALGASNEQLRADNTEMIAQVQALVWQAQHQGLPVHQLL